MKRFSIFLLAIACMGFFDVLHAQNLSDIRFKTLNVKDGLSSSTVSDVLKDDFGYMWFATDDGLNKFDGLNFTVYRNNPKDSSSITSNDIADLFLDNSGNLWICTNNGYVSVYDRKKDKFVNIKLPKLKGRSLGSDAQGRIWIGGYEGLAIYDPKSKKMIVANREWKNFTIGQRVIMCILRDSKNQIWLGTDRGLAVYRPNTGTFQKFEHNPLDPTSLPSNYVPTVVEDKRGNIWVGSEGGLSKLEHGKRSFKTFSATGSQGKTTSSSIIYSLALEGNNRLWIGTEEGLNIMDLRSETIASAGRPNTGPYHLSGKSVRSILVDRHGLFWVGTYQGGVNKYDKNLALFNLRQANPDDPKGLSAATVTSFVEGSSPQEIYIGTDGGGLNLFHRKTNSFDHIPLPAKADGKLLSIMTMEKIAGKIWIGTYFDGLFIYDPKTGRTERIRAGKGPNDLTSDNIFTIKEDKRGKVWIGTNGTGVNIYDPVTQKFEHFDDRLRTKDRNAFLINTYDRSIAEDIDGNIWISTVGTGVACYNPEKDQIISYNVNNSNIASNDILSIAIDSAGIVWLGTGNNGLCMFNKKKNNFQTFSEPQGLANAFIHKVVVGDDARIWVSTNKGISCFDPASRKFRNYSYNNGLQRNTFVLGSGLKLSNGELFFGGVDGFNFFDPRQLNINKNQPKIILTDLKIANRSVVPGDDSPIKEHISEANEVRLDYKQNFSISFAALNYTSPEECIFSYKLDGFDKNWNEVGRATTASYTNLDPGVYTFHVRARSDAGWWETPSTSLTIYVQPPFWRTIYAYIFYVLLAGGLLFALRYRGIKKLEQKFALEQERREAKRMIEEERREAERLHEIDQVKLKFLTNLSHDFRTPISLIMGPVEKLIQKESNKDNASQLNMIRRNSKRLLNLVNQLLDYRKLEEQDLKLNLSNGDIITFLHEVAESFRDVADRKNIIFKVESGLEHYHTSFDRDKVERMMFNLLSNAFKFTFEGGKVTLSVNATASPDTGISIELSDTGIGIRKEAQAKIFDRFFQSSSSAISSDQGSGIGLTITKEFVRMHGGTISLMSEFGKGSTFSIFLPLELIDTQLIEDDPAEDETMIIAENPETAQAGSPHKTTILLVEDSDDFRFYLKDNLKNYYRVIEAADGKEGWQKALANHPVVVVSDVNMPVMDGFELCRKIKTDRRTNQIPVILLTALNDQNKQVKGLETGASDYITKPFNFEILRVKIDNLIKQNQTLKDTYTRQIKVVGTEVKIELEEERLMAKIMEYIESKLTDPQLSVEDLSRHVGMSRGSLYRRIVDITGETPVEFIRSIKLERARVLLEKSDMRISQICYAVGFSTPNYFAKAFKMKYNMLPSEYVQQKRSTEDIRIK